MLGGVECAVAIRIGPKGEMSGLQQKKRRKSGGDYLAKRVLTVYKGGQKPTNQLTGRQAGRRRDQKK